MRAEPNIPFPHSLTTDSVLLEPYFPSKDHRYQDAVSFTGDS